MKISKPKLPTPAKKEGMRLWMKGDSNVATKLNRLIFNTAYYQLLVNREAGELIFQ